MLSKITAPRERNFLLPGNRLYHYCSWETAVSKILPAYQLLLNPIDKTNDPRENQRFMFSHRTYKQIDIAGMDVADKYISTRIREGVKVCCFSEDRENYWGCLLSKMWAHYGGNHKGVCLELDKQKFIDENGALYDMKFLQPMTYFAFDRNNPPDHHLHDHVLMDKLGEDAYVKKFRQENLKYFFYTKNKEWESECEIRLLHIGEKDKDEFCSIKNSLCNIYIGLNCPIENVRAIEECIADTDMRIVFLSYGDVGLQFDFSSYK